MLIFRNRSSAAPFLKPVSRNARARPRHLEEETQIACVQWFRLAYPDRMIFAIPNGGRRGMLEGVRLKKQGVLAGVSDLFIPEPARGFHGLWVEMKAPKGRLSPEQGDFQIKMIDRGYAAAVCRSFEEFQTVTNRYFGG